MDQTIRKKLDIRQICKQYKLPIWHCPQFLFLIMGVVISGTSLITYFLGTRYVGDPILVAMVVLGIAVVLFVITFSIIRSMEGLAEANRLKSEFISVVSHQLRSPLSNLKWSLEVLVSERFGKLEGKQKEYLHILQDNTKRMGELVSDLLMVSRIEQGRLPLNKSAFFLEEIVKKMIADYKPFSEASKVELKMEASKSVPQVEADPSKIKVVVENLIDNAIKYSQNGGRGGKVKVRIAPQNSKLVLFSIQDDGIGIPKKDQKYIFKKFFRSGNVLKHQTQGSGLGLNIVKSIIEKSGGRMWFRSQENKGTTFYFTLPAKK